MESSISWVQPLLLLPGVALLIVSTSYRFGQIQTEVHHLLMDEFRLPDKALQHLLQRIVLVRNALTGLYSSIALFALGSISGELTLPMGTETSSLIVAIFTGVGITSLLFSVLGLVRESLLSTEVLQDHIKQITSSKD